MKFKIEKHTKEGSSKSDLSYYIRDKDDQIISHNNGSDSKARANAEEIKKIIGDINTSAAYPKNHGKIFDLLLSKL